MHLEAERQSCFRWKERKEGRVPRALAGLLYLLYVDDRVSVSKKGFMN